MCHDTIGSGLLEILISPWLEFNSNPIEIPVAYRLPMGSLLGIDALYYKWSRKDQRDWKWWVIKENQILLLPFKYIPPSMHKSLNVPFFHPRPFRGSTISTFGTALSSSNISLLNQMLIINNIQIHPVLVTKSYILPTLKAPIRV